MNTARGFSLIELLIAIAIVGILASVAYPTYQNYTKSSYNSAAQQALLDIASAEEQYRLDTRTYTDLATLQANAGLQLSDKAQQYFTFTTVNTTSTFTATATPTGSGLSTFTIDNTGAKTPSGW